jgi:hypothetical protein
MRARGCSVGWSVQKLALFLAVSLLVRPVQPNSAKGRGESRASQLRTSTLRQMAPRNLNSDIELWPKIPCTQRAGVVLESVVPDVGTAHGFTAVALYGSGLNKNLVGEITTLTLACFVCLYEHPICSPLSSVASLNFCFVRPSGTTKKTLWRMMPLFAADAWVPVRRARPRVAEHRCGE